MFAGDHYSLKGFSDVYHPDGSCASFMEGLTVEDLTLDGDVYLYYELENRALTFYADIRSMNHLPERPGKPASDSRLKTCLYRVADRSLTAISL